MVSIDAFQALDLGSIPGRRIPFFSYFEIYTALAVVFDHYFVL